MKAKATNGAVKKNGNGKAPAKANSKAKATKKTAATKPAVTRDMPKHVFEYPVTAVLRTMGAKLEMNFAAAKKALAKFTTVADNTIKRQLGEGKRGVEGADLTQKQLAQLKKAAA
jgi:hypothetical protein